MLDMEVVEPGRVNKGATTWLQPLVHQGLAGPLSLRLGIARDMEFFSIIEYTQAPYQCSSLDFLVSFMTERYR